MVLPTADLLDAHPELPAADPIFRDFGGRKSFHGPMEVVGAPEDNTHVRAALETAGGGRVLVVDGGGSTACALVGGNLAELAAQNGWAGIVVNGCVRDSVELALQPVGIKALAPFPRKSQKLGRGGPVESASFASVEFRTGEWLYADEDGIVLSSAPLG
jgi:regulator of ribonuclease activity A